MSQRWRSPPRRSQPPPASANGDPAQPSITEDPTAPVGQPPAVPEPPDAVASATGRRALLGIGSYCWLADDGGPSACIDWSGIVTAADALPVGRGETVVVNGPGLPWAVLREAAVHVRPATDEPNTSMGVGSYGPPKGRPRACPPRDGATVSPFARISSPAAGWPMCSSGSIRAT